jgi:hypothetical protein
MSNGKRISNFEEIHQNTPKSIAKPCIVPTTISINLSINRLLNNTVLNLPLKQRRKLVIEFLRKYP